ncbi:MAG: hypothetical protein GX874_12880 [Smithella sp.]|nr:hypothetical protein [Smithella sp.]
MILMVPGVSAAQGAGNAREACYQYHSQIKSPKEGSKHAALSCDICHSGVKEHLQGFRNKPVTAIDHRIEKRRGHPDPGQGNQMTYRRLS